MLGVSDLTKKDGYLYYHIFILLGCITMILLSNDNIWSNFSYILDLFGLCKFFSEFTELVLPPSLFINIK